MRTRLKKVIAGVCALGAVAVGGAAISQAGSAPPQKSPRPTTEHKRNVPENSAIDRDTAQDKSGKDDASEKADGFEKGEKADRSEQGEKADGAEQERTGSETPDDDGPGGHADEPANPNADHQREGQE